jgi:hypothetical protein
VLASAIHLALPLPVKALKPWRARPVVLLRRLSPKDKLALYC